MCIVLSDQAKEDLAEIYDYILNVLKSEINAESVLNRLYSAMSKLSYMAESYHLYPNEPWNSKGVHYFSVGNYSIFYVAENNVATVIHVSYGRRDLDKVLANYK
ncbi:type II toxin-antitoxin system RelE/ParE family toxin [Treponema zioleckii]|uniref:type II toxin-antitoxin system RelE/ParE family toxin n=1 Tax=Treponema zioleckii TaxID=331680 RepID=UPI00168A623C